MNRYLSIHIKKELHTAEGRFPLSVQLDIEKGEFVALTGPSGSGKTTLLRLIAGLTKSDQGQILFNDTVWSDHSKQQFLPPQKRSIGFVFQDYALFPNMTVQQNLTFALDKSAPSSEVENIIEMIDLTALANRFPHQLSGGQQQRVALARALVRKPKILLLDEPLSALDTAMRERLQDDLKRLHEDYKLTTILVTHNEKEIFKLADRAIVLETGKIIDKGNPEDILSKKGIFATIQKMEIDGKNVKLTCQRNGDLLTLILPNKMAEKYQVGEVIFIN
ncbi:MAG: ATP-binding cassette domain-containing protein [Bacteroidetes bacterium]|jgi:molybdate transport system ATP-binding protein|nr:ATP-binding cassette domain-containing protein [Bacteroidota bacterium]MDF1864464.1 ATP-binding cassette domain-containing protein [Saprospiraceae bacterium]